MSTSRPNLLFWALLLVFSGAIAAFMALGPNPGPQSMEVIEFEMDSTSAQSGRDIPRPRPRQTTPAPVNTQPVQAEDAPASQEVPEHVTPEPPTNQPLEQAPSQHDIPPAPPETPSGVSTNAAAAAKGFITKKDYLQLLTMRIEARKSYPDQARRRHQEGLVVIEFELEKKGEVSAVRVHKSSGSTPLDRAARRAVEKSAPFPRAPQGIFDFPVRLRIGVSFELT